MTDQTMPQVPTLEPLRTYSDREAAKIVMGDQCLDTSWKYIQLAIRRGHLRAQKAGRQYRILGQSIIEWMSQRNKK